MKSTAERKALLDKIKEQAITEELLQVQENGKSRNFFQTEIENDFELILYCVSTILLS